MSAPQTHFTSIVMVSYHTGDILWSAIEHALSQTMPVELIIVDNGNPPDVVTKLSEMAGGEPRLRLVTGQGNVGFGRACNLGAKNAKGDCLLMLNPDCLLPPDAVAGMLRHLGVVTPPALLGTRLVNKDGSDQRGSRRALLTPVTALVEALHLGKLFPRYRLNFNEAVVPDHLAPVPAISGAFMFMSKVDYDLIGGFDEAYFLHVEDLDFCLRFHRAGGGIYFAPDICVTHVGGTSDVSSAFTERCKADGFRLYFKRNFAGQYPRPLFWLLSLAIWLRMKLRGG